MIGGGCPVRAASAGAPAWYVRAGMGLECRELPYLGRPEADGSHFCLLVRAKVAWGYPMPCLTHRSYAWRRTRSTIRAS
jgi:hypothetical protein